MKLVETLRHSGEHLPDDVVDRRYRIVAELGRGACGITYEVEDLTNHQHVALKVLSLSQAENWQVVKLFAREAKVLQTLDHPNIPKYLNDFYLDTECDRRFYLVRELVEGRSLADWVASGWHATEKQIEQIAVQVLKVLKYLHLLKKPVIHRDINPHNIIRQPDGTIFLVDFGAVQDIYRSTIARGSTFVGTLGYMPPEQFRGDVSTASDLYALGATLLFLATHRSPADLPQARLKIDLSNVRLSPGLRGWLEQLLEPTVQKRLASVRDAVYALGLATGSLRQTYRQPAGSTVKFKRSNRRLVVENIPDRWGVNALVFVAIAIVSLGAIAALDVWIATTLGKQWYGSFSLLGTVLVANVAIALWGSFHRTRLEIDEENFTISRSRFGFYRQFRGKRSRLYPYLDEGLYLLSQGSAGHFKNVGRRKHRQGQQRLKLEAQKATYEVGFLLKDVEKEWLHAEITDFLGLPARERNVPHERTNVPAERSSQNTTGNGARSPIFKPANTKIRIEKSDRHMKIEIPSFWATVSRIPSILWIVVALVLFALLTKSLVATILTTAISILLAKDFFCQTTVEIDLESYRVYSLYWKFSNHESGKTETIDTVKVVHLDLYGEACAILNSQGTALTFGFMTRRAEKDWVVAEISNFLKTLAESRQATKRSSEFPGTENNEIRIEKRDRQITIDLPPMNLFLAIQAKEGSFTKRDIERFYSLALGLGFVILVTLTGLSFLINAISASASVGLQVVSLVLGGAIFFIGSKMLVSALQKIFCHTQIAINAENYQIHRRWWRLWHQKIGGKTADILHVSLERKFETMTAKPFHVCKIVDVDKEYEFGIALQQSDKERVVSEILDFLGKLRSRNTP